MNIQIIFKTSRKKYDKMMKKAREKALKRAVELGALTEEDMELYGSGKKEEQARSRQKRRDLRIEMQLLNIQIISSLQSLQKNMDAFIYTKDFYVALYKRLESGMTSIEAYESLGFDTKKLERTVLSLRPSAQDRKRRTGSLNQRLRTMMEASLLRRCLK
ncbi:hypothetical protein [Catenibacterium sp. co_0103]|uniref:hypothetical protein n=1 Tax=Catenibacterium sp. co_0103 TaxID=2478954 RepID=UPI0024799491|nr:hypothetical protein [Catenibacterium sp. co_0103]